MESAGGHPAHFVAGGGFSDDGGAGGGGGSGGFDARVWHQQRHRGDYYADRLVEEVRAQLTMLEQLKRRHSLPPSPPESPVKSPSTTETVGSVGVAGAVAPGAREGHGATRNESNTGEDGEGARLGGEGGGAGEGATAKTFATAGVQVAIPVKGPKIKSRGTHPHCVFPASPPPPPLMSTAGTQCDVIEAAATSVQTEAPPSPISVRCGPDHTQAAVVSQSCGPSRPTSPDPDTVAAATAVPAMTTVKTSTEVSIPFDAPEPLWKGTSEYPVAEVAEKQRAPITVVAYPGSAVEAGLGQGGGAGVGAPGTGHRDRVDDGGRNGAASGSANVAGNVANQNKNMRSHRHGRGQRHDQIHHIPGGEVQYHSDGDDSLSLSDSETESDEGSGGDWSHAGVAVKEAPPRVLEDSAGPGARAPHVHAPFSTPAPVASHGYYGGGGRSQSQWEFVATPDSVAPAAAAVAGSACVSTHTGDISRGHWAGAAGDIPQGVMSAAKVRRMYPELFRRGDVRGGGGGGGSGGSTGYTMGKQHGGGGGSDEDEDDRREREEEEEEETTTTTRKKKHHHDEMAARAKAGRVAIKSGELWRGLPDSSSSLSK